MKGKKKKQRNCKLYISCQLYMGQAGKKPWDGMEWVGLKGWTGRKKTRKKRHFSLTKEKRIICMVGVKQRP